MDFIHEYLQHWADTKPAQCYAGFLDGLGNIRHQHTFSEFHELTKRIAARLKRSDYLGNGHRALLVYPPGLDGVATLMACARIGVIAVPAPFPPLGSASAALSRIAKISVDCGASVILTTCNLQRSLHVQCSQGACAPVDLPPCISTDDVAEEPPAHDGQPNPILFLQYTSGSTGDPRGVIVSHHNVIENAKATLDHVPTGVSWLPQYHDMGLVGYYLFPMILGGTNYGLSPVDFLKRPSIWFHAITRLKATYASSPNFGLEYCLRDDKLPESELQGVNLGSLRVLMNAAEPVRATTQSKFFERFHRYGLQRSALVAAYGLAENTLAVTHFGRRVVALDGDKPHSTVVSCGRPLAGVRVSVVDPSTRTSVQDGQTGEIWVSGTSTCQGYWDRPDLTASTFGNGLEDDSALWLRTGDLGFMHEGELFVSGRLKDVIIVHGANCYPHDIEAVVESCAPEVRPGGVVVFAGQQHGDEIVVLAEIKLARKRYNPEAIARMIVTQCSIQPAVVALVHVGAIVRTTSGKIARSATRAHWYSGKIRPIAIHRSSTGVRTGTSSPLDDVRSILQEYGVADTDGRTLAEIGIDSLSLTLLLSCLERRLAADEHAAWLQQCLDPRALQETTVADLFAAMSALDCGVSAPKALSPRGVQTADELMMRKDAVLAAGAFAQRHGRMPIGRALLTGPTGFFGPFLLHSLLRHTRCSYDLLTRAADPEQGMQRVRSAMQSAGLWSSELAAQLRERVRIVCGDIAQPRLGLDQRSWTALADRIDAIIHNAALVNYVLNYSSMRMHNVEGTRELLRLASIGKAKEFHHISSTIIFGWTSKALCLESDKNPEMYGLDFGYAQSKWVSEQLVISAQRQQLAARIYRPSFICASTDGIGAVNDIVILILGFMIRHGIAVSASNQVSFLPADIAADNAARMIADRDGGACTYHLTVDNYYSLEQVTRAMTRNYGFTFRYCDLREFAVEMKRLCTPADPVYPLLYFFTRNFEKLHRMEGKRYDNRNYRAARLRTGGAAEPSVDETAAYLMTCLQRTGLVQTVPM